MPHMTLSAADRAEASAALETLSALLASLPPPAWADALQAAAEALRQRLRAMLASGTADPALLETAAYLDKVSDAVQDAVQAAQAAADAIRDYLPG